VFRLINLESLTVLAYSLETLKFRLIKLESLTLMAYFFRDSNCFALLIKVSNPPDPLLRDSKSLPLLI